MKTLSHKFVKNIPDELEDGVIYVSIEYATTIHQCCCGCGHEVVTPLSPTDWKLTFDGKSVSLHPSIGNWSTPCQSHYWIKRNMVSWSRQWSKQEIQQGRKQEQAEKWDYFKKTSAKEDPKKKTGFLSWFFKNK